MKKNKAVFLDRDGVLNESIVVDGKPYAPKSLDEFKIVPGVNKLTKQLHNAGYWVFVITNQPDVGNGYTKRTTVERMNELLRVSAVIDEIYVCYHSQNENCTCRKPSVGLLEQAQIEFGFNRKKSFLIGDRGSDIAAGNNYGLRTIFIDYQYDEITTEYCWRTVDNLGDAIRCIFEINQKLE